MYTFECGHNTCLSCMSSVVTLDPSERKCVVCGFGILNMPPPFDRVRRNCLYYIFGKDPMTEDAYRTSITSEMQGRAGSIKIRMYGKRLDDEMDAVGDVSILTRCSCNLVCVRTQNARDSSKFFYGCPRWRSKAQPGCAFYMPLTAKHGVNAAVAEREDVAPKPVGALDF